MGLGCFSKDMRPPCLTHLSWCPLRDPSFKGGGIQLEDPALKDIKHFVNRVKDGVARLPAAPADLRREVGVSSVFHHGYLITAGKSHNVFERRIGSAKIVNQNEDGSIRRGFQEP